MEFSTFKKAHAIPWILTVWDIKTDEIIILSTIDHNLMLLVDIEAAIAAR